MPVATIQCPECGSKNIVSRQDALSYCRRCGYKGPSEAFKVARKP